MKSILEQIPIAPNSSFRLLVDPKLHDFYYWHFHPEVELVYIEGVNGTRHIGHVQSRYQDGDMALIGPYIPHLNFDYGIKEEYFKIVLQFDIDIINAFGPNLPELKKIRELLNDAKHGIYFDSEKKQQVGKMMKELIPLKGFAFFNMVMKIFDCLAEPNCYFLVHKHPYQNQFYQKQEDRIREVLKYIETNYSRRITVKELAKISNYSEGAFSRYFKKMTKLSFTSFLNNYRIDIAKRMLASGSNVTETAFDCGFESISYFNRVFKQIAGKSPSKWKIIEVEKVSLP